MRGAKSQAEAEGKHVLFFALSLPPEARREALARLEAIRGPQKLTGRATAEARLHISLNNLGRFRRPPEAVIEKARDLVDAVEGRRFVVSLNRIGTWQSGESPWPVVLWGDEGVIGVEALHAALHRILAKASMVPRRQAEMTPHLTVSWDKAVADETFIEPVTWTADAFELIHSVQGEGRYDVVGRWPLVR